MKRRSINISFFHCSNSISIEEMNRVASRLEEVELSPISVPCSGKVNIQYILKSIETGSDAAILAGCKIGDCRFLQGNLRGQKRIDAVNDLLNETGIGTENVKFVEIDPSKKIEQLIKEINNYARQMKLEHGMIKEPF